MDASVVGPRDSGGADADGASEALDASAPLRVLFLGNSLTYVNDLPSVVRDLGAATPGGAVEVDSVTVGSATLLSLWAGSAAQDRIAHGGFGAVVLQGQSAETIVDPTGFASGAILLAGAARDAGARPVWYSTWATGPSDPGDASLGATNDLTRRIEHQYELAASVNGGVVARVGAAWQLAQVEMPAVQLLGGDNLHPTPAGTLLAACVLHQALTGRTPRVPDPAPLGLATDTARALCAFAARVQCAEGLFACDGSCVNLQTTYAHCGRCGVACSAVDPCVQGHCGCSLGYTPCDRRYCARLSSDLANCGACGHACPSGGACNDGGCRCPATSALRVNDTTARALPSECTTFGAAPTEACSAAVHSRCGALDCFTSGFGPTLVGGTGLSTVCTSSELHRASYTELRALVPECDGVRERLGPNCSTAVHRYCRAAGAASGFGPVETAGDAVTVSCLPNATVLHTSYTAMMMSQCDGVTQRWGFECGWASSFFCMRNGHTTGFGPLELAGDELDVVCVDP